jgi:Ca-activated chloride channel family protein
MNRAEKEIKEALRRMKIPEPSEAARKKAVREAMDEFARKTVLREKKSQGIAGIVRRMGRTLRNLFTLQGGPIMTQKQLASLGALVIAFGLFLTLVPLEMYREKTTGPGNVPTPEKKSAVDSIPARPGKPGATGASRQQDTAPRPPGEARREKTGAAPPPLAGENTGALQYRSLMSEPQQAMPGRMENRAAEGLPGQYYRDEGRDRFPVIDNNPIRLVAEDPVSTFSVDVDTSSYGFVRRQLLNGVLPQKDAVRVEELINYFDYAYPVPRDRAKPFLPTVAVLPTPWNDNTRLLHIGIKGFELDAAEKPRANLVFLVDVSGSMNSPDKLPLLKNSLSMLVDTLETKDTVAIAVYAGAAGTVLEPTPAGERGKILAALNRLQAGGSTAGGEGIRLAYSLAEMHFDPEAVNRVILATDGDFNVGITDPRELKGFVERKRETGIYLSVLGFGQGNYNDALMQELAQNGNGNAAYIDNLNEARKVLVDEAASTLFTIARDVKIQVEFNPARVHDYRLIGYETRMLRREDFNNDRVDAGDIGSGHSVTAIYEFTPADSAVRPVDDLRYRQAEPAPPTDTGDEYAFVKIRYKLPKGEKSSLIARPVTGEDAYPDMEAAPPDMRFAAAVAAFGQVLRNDPYTGDFGYDDIIALAGPARGQDLFGYRTGFLNLVRLAKTAGSM